MKNIFRKLSISQKLWSLTGIIISIPIIYFYFYFIQVTEKQFKEGLLKKGNGLVQTASYNLGPGLYFHQVEFIKRVLQGMENDTDVSFIFVMSEEGDRIYGFRDENYFRIIDNFKKSNQIQNFLEKHLLLKQSIFFNDELQGYLITGFSLEWVKIKISEQRKDILIVTIILIISMFVLTFVVSHAISKPIKNAVSKIDQFRGDVFNPHIRLPEGGDDEIAQLSVAFNCLAESLDQNLRELDQSKKYVEAFFRMSPVPMLIIDSRGNIEVANESACNFFSLKLTDILSKQLDFFLDEENINKIVRKLNTDEEEIHGYVTSISFPQIENKIVEINISTLYDQYKIRKKFIFAIIDITEKINSQKEILEKQSNLRRVNRELIQKTSQLESVISKKKENSEKLALLIENGQELFRSRTAKEVFKLLVNSGKNLLNAEKTILFITTQNKKQLVPYLTYPENLIKNLKLISANSDGIVNKTFNTNSPLFLNKEDLKPCDFNELGINHEQKINLMSVPLSEKDYKLGVIVCFSEKESAFELEDLHLITTLAHQAAMTLEKIYLMQALREKADHLEKAYSELKKSQQQVLQLQKMESLGTLVGGIAHDFNNILGIIIPNTDLLRMAAASDKEILKRVSIIHEAAGRASDLTRQLLMFSRNQDVELEPLFPKKLVIRVANMLKRTLGKHIIIQTELDSYIPAIKADETRLTQVLINLAVNARDAMPNGGILTLGVSYDKSFPKRSDNGKQDFVCISVKDTGTGISQEIFPKIYDPFFTTKDVGTGTGLGLSVVYGIVKSHNGIIQMESKEGKGTIFYIYFVPVKENPVPKSLPKVEFIPKGKEKILVIDDEEMIRNSLHDILRSLGYFPITANGGEEAIDILKKDNIFDLAIVDFVMPKMNGIETVKALKSINPELKIILSTGLSDRKKLITDAVKIDGYLLKPYHISDLAQKLKSILYPVHSPDQ
jgi:PAS domain S-box-containing protein